MKKIILVGDYYVGKTCIVTTLLNGPPKDQQPYIPTVATSTFFYERGGEKYQIWDTAGQERYRSITSAYYRGAHGALVVYDITSKKTFDSVEKWVNDLKTNGEPKMVIMVIGNKADKEEERVITKVDGEAKSQRNNVAFLETSALTAENIEQAFEEVIQKLCTTYKSDFDNDAQYEFGEGTKGNTIDIGTKSDQQKSKKCCE
jgi:Ras-related protein Rab-11A